MFFIHSGILAGFTERKAESVGNSIIKMSKTCVHLSKVVHYTLCSCLPAMRRLHDELNILRIASSPFHCVALPTTKIERSKDRKVE
jgi:hypothetical protein